MTALLSLYAVVSLCGWAVLPAARSLCPSLPDRGQSVCRCLGWVVATWIAWMMATVARRPLNRTMVAAALLLTATACRTPALLRRMRPARSTVSAKAPASATGRGSAGMILWVEGVFLVALVLAALLESHNPAVDPDSERFMDYALLKSCLRAPGLPVPDPWMAGAGLAYYHFAYDLMAFLVRACGRPPASLLTSLVALPHALLLQAVFGCGLALTHRVRGGLLAALLGVCGGNLQWVHQGLAALRPAAFDWFAPSRVIEGTITEFPWFSLLWGDPHPYAFALPLVVCALAIVLGLALDEDRAPWGPRAGATAVALAVLAGAVLAAHPWDFPILLGTAFLVVAILPSRGRRFSWMIVPVAACLSRILFGPFIAGVPLGGHALQWVPRRSAPSEWLMAYAPFLLVGGAGLIGAAIGRRGRSGTAAAPPGARRASLAILSAGTLTALACEVVYVRDLFETTPLLRMNTVFKLHRLAWILLALATVALAHRFEARRAGRFLVALALLPTLVYPVFGTASWMRAPRADAGHRPEGAQGAAVAEGADAEALFRAEWPDDAAAASFVAQNAGGSEALLEETGDAYTWSARISTFSGVPGVLGWGNHEAVWRQGWDEVQRRRTDIATMYARPGEREGCDLLRRYGVRFIIVGKRERDGYGAAVERFAVLASPSFVHGTTAVFESGSVCEAGERTARP